MIIGQPPTITRRIRYTRSLIPKDRFHRVQAGALCSSARANGGFMTTCSRLSGALSLSILKFWLSGIFLGGASGSGTIVRLVAYLQNNSVLPNQHLVVLAPLSRLLLQNIDVGQDYRQQCQAFGYHTKLRGTLFGRDCRS